MKRLISVKEIDDLVRKKGDLRSLPVDAIYTPSARERLLELKFDLAANQSSNGSPKKESSHFDSLFHSKEIQKLKEEMCEIGRRLWARAYVDGNGGNISVRVGENLVLCTPTLISKGFMKPEDMCLVDLEGNQKAGSRQRTSEILTHLAVMKAQPKAKAVVHCHPPHATAFAIAKVKPPTCMLPEIEIFAGEVPIAEYDTPGTPPVGEYIAQYVKDHNTILMANHGAIAWSDTVENAYLKMEIVEAYCQTVVIAAHLGTELKTFSPAKLQDLLKMKQKIGIPDRRIGLKECELCDNSEWRVGSTSLPSQAVDQNELDPEAEAAVQTITDIILEQLKHQP